MHTPQHRRVTTLDLARVIYTSGTVFDGLRTGRLDTENFLRSGDTSGVTSRADLALLEDLRAAATYVVDHAGVPVDAGYVRAVNAAMTRSAALHPGRLRTRDQAIGVQTRYGRHEPGELSNEALQAVIDQAGDAASGDDRALHLFVSLARAQPFEDGNKRTALFAANGLLLSENSMQLLSVPFDERDPAVADRFNDLLARAYVYDDRLPVIDMLRSQGLVELEPRSPQSIYERFPELDPKNREPDEQSSESDAGFEF